MTITGQSSLAKDDIDRMVKDAEAHAEDDRQRKLEAEARNIADNLVYQTEKILRDQGDKVSADEKAAIQTAIDDLKGSLEEGDAETISAKTQTLIQASMKLGEAMYKAQQGEPGAEAADSDAGASSDDVVDAEFEEVDGDEKKSA